MPYAKKENKGDKYDNKGTMSRKPRKKVCQYCHSENAAVIDYKDFQALRKFTSERGKILPRRITGCCAKHQRQLTIAIKRARHLALLSFSAD